MKVGLILLTTVILFKKFESIQSNNAFHINKNIDSEHMNINIKFTIKFENVTYKFEKQKIQSSKIFQ